MPNRCVNHEPNHSNLGSTFRANTNGTTFNDFNGGIRERARKAEEENKKFQAELAQKRFAEELAQKKIYSINKLINDHITIEMLKTEVQILLQLGTCEPMGNGFFIEE